MPTVSLVLFLTIEDDDNQVGLVTPSRDLQLDLTPEQQAHLLDVARDILSTATVKTGGPGT